MPLWKTQSFSMILTVMALAMPGLASGQASQRQADMPLQDDVTKQPQQETPPMRVSRVANSAVGEAGQRNTTAQLADRPGTRLLGRLQNRVQSRLRNRIDRYYDPQANTTSPFAVAAEQAQAKDRKR